MLEERDRPRPSKREALLSRAGHCGVMARAAPGDASQSSEGAWLPFLDTFRTLCVAPEPGVQRLLEEIRELDFAA